MRTLRSAAARLAAAGGIAELVPLIDELGFTAPPVGLDESARVALGLPETVLEASVAAGTGSLRALLVVVAPGAPLRDELRRIAARLAGRLPHVLWLLVAGHRGRGQVALAAWQTGAERRTTRVAALVADRDSIVDSDAETLLSLAASTNGASDVLTHARWVEILGRDALSRRFYRELERRVDALARSARWATSVRLGPDAASELGLLYTSRMLFLAFLQAKGWLDSDRAFLERGYDACVANGGGYHRRVLRPLFFGTLNTRPSSRAPVARAFGRVPFLNGGLFSPTPLERGTKGLTFGDDAFGALFGELLSRYRFTAREDRSSWSEAAIDPEMLGRAFESLMATRSRRDSGAYFTPQPLVEHLTALALRSALGDAHPPALTALRRLTVLDPACGSGAFLVHALERVADLRREAGDVRPVSDVRRDVLTRSIFGVDRNPTAVWLCELRLWLSVVIESDEDDPRRVPTLPNLDRSIRVGDSLSGGAFTANDVLRPRAAARIETMRARYARANGARKETLARALERAERRIAIERLDLELRQLTGSRRERVVALRAPDLFGQRTRPNAAERATSAELRARVMSLRRERQHLVGGGALPFSFAVQFADVANRQGFDVVIGNPPWVRLHRIPPATRRALRREYVVFRNAAWVAGAGAAHAGRGFAAQVDLAALFAERSLRLLRPGGTLALLVPAKLWRSLAGGGVRQLLASESSIGALEDWSDARAAFDAAVYPSAIVATRVPCQPDRDVVDAARGVTIAIHLKDRVRTWSAERGALALDESPGSPWILLPPDVRAAFDRFRAAGVPLARSALGRPHLGVKCGCNDAFVVSQPDNGTRRGAPITGADGRTGCVEPDLLRPVLHGEDVRAWRGSASHLIIWTHGADDRPLATLPPLAARWLSAWRTRLARRSDLRRRESWWTIFRVEAASPDRPRVVWADLAREPRAFVLEAGDRTVPLNSCYVVSCATLPDADALAAIFNSRLAAAWLDALAEPARGHYRRYLGWTTALLPIPHDWNRARAVLAPLGQRGRAGHPPDAAELTRAMLCAYDLDYLPLEPLLGWTTS